MVGIECQDYKYLLYSYYKIKTIDCKLSFGEVIRYYNDSGIKFI